LNLILNSILNWIWWINSS